MSKKKSVRTTKANNLVELGVTGLKQNSGRVNEEFLNQLKGKQKYKTFKEMADNDPVVGAILFAIEMLIRNTKWRMVPFNESKDQKDIDNAEFVESCLHDMSTSWEDTIAEILSFLTFGYSYHEIVYKKRNGDPSSRFNDGKIGWKKLPIRAQETLERWVFTDRDGGIEGFVQRPPNGGAQITIPIEKALLFRTTVHKGNPEGKSILRNSYRPWFFKKRIEEIEGIGIERDLAGLPVMKVPAKIMSSAATAADKAIFNSCKDIVQNIRRDEQEGVIMPGDLADDGKPIYELSLLSAGGKRQFDTSKIVNRYDQRIAMTVLADFILLGHDKVGSFALSSDKTNLFAAAIGTVMDSVSSVFNRHAIPRLFRINGMPVEELPTLEHGDIESPDLDKLASYIDKLSKAGMTLFPDEILENQLREHAGLPDRPEDMDDFIVEDDEIVPDVEDDVVTDPNENQDTGNV